MNKINNVIKDNLKNKYNEIFNPLKIPSDINLAEIHKKAKRIKKKNFEKNKNLNLKRCSCCGLSYNEDYIKFFDSIYEFAHLGSSYSLYFNFIEFICILNSLYFFNRFFY